MLMKSGVFALNLGSHPQCLAHGAQLISRRWRQNCSPMGMFFCLAIFAIPTSLFAGELRISVGPVRNTNGFVLVAIYDNKENFLDLTHAKALAKLRARPGTVWFGLPELSPGKYAVAVIHDENGNEQLDKNLVGIPVEGWGFSNDARATLGPPEFQAAAVEFTGTDTSIEIKLHY